MYVDGNVAGTTGQPQRSINMGVYGTNCGIEVFFKRYFGNFSFHVRYCGITWPCGVWFCIFWLKIFGKRRLILHVIAVPFICALLSNTSQYRV